MVKLRLFFVAIFLCGLGPAPAWAQTHNYADNTRNNRSGERVVVSPEARAEAKRLYKEGVKYGVARLFAQAAEMFERAVKLDPQNAESIYNVRMHMLSQGDRFDLIAREPRKMTGRAAERLPEKEQEEKDKAQTAA